MPFFVFSSVRRSLTLLTVSGALFSAAPSLSEAQLTSVLAPLRDATLFEEVEERASGAGPHLFSGLTATNLRRRALLAFDIASSIPEGSTVLDVELTIDVDRAQLGRTIRFELRRVTSDWGEGASAADVPGGRGAPPEPGDATWTHTFFDTDDWTTAGGDFEAAGSGSADLFGLGMATFTGAGLASDVQTWLDDPGTNYGWALVGEEAATMNAIRFLSRESGTGPALSVTYAAPPGTTAIPTASSLGLALLALILGVASVRRLAHLRLG